MPIVPSPAPRIHDLAARLASAGAAERDSAVERVGDASLVPALARAASEDASPLGPGTETFASFARGHRLRRTSPALPQVPARYRETLDAFLAGSRQGRR